MIKLPALTICGKEYRVRQTSERMGQVLVLNADGSILGRGASRVQAVRDARMNFHRPAEIETMTTAELATVHADLSANDFCKIHETAGAERVSVARLRVGDVVSFEASTKQAATFWKVTSIKAVPGTRPRQPRRYEIEITDGRGVSSFGASTKVWKR